MTGTQMLLKQIGNQIGVDLTQIPDAVEKVKTVIPQLLEMVKAEFDALKQQQLTIIEQNREIIALLRSGKENSNNVLPIDQSTTNTVGTVTGVSVTGVSAAD